jgi:hypothetical protein
MFRLFIALMVLSPHGVPIAWTGSKAGSKAHLQVLEAPVGAVFWVIWSYFPCYVRLPCVKYSPAMWSISVMLSEL